MSLEILNLTYDHHTGRITLAGKEERFRAGGFDVLRTENLVLNPGEGSVWPGFMKTLKEIYHSDCFDIDFHGSRTALETMRSKCGGEDCAAYELYFEGTHVDNLETVKYRSERLSSLYEKIDSYNYAYLNRLAFLTPFRELLDSDLKGCLSEPDENMMAQMSAVLEAGNDCLEEARVAYRNEEKRQETSRNGDQFLNRRLCELQSITHQLCPLSWDGLVFMDGKKPLTYCRTDLQKLTDMTAGLIREQNVLPNHWNSVLQIRYCMFLRTCEAAIRQKASRFTESTNQKIQNLQDNRVWKNKSGLANYPLLESFSAEKTCWDPKIPEEYTTPQQLLSYMHDYTLKLIEDVYGQYHDNFIETWQEMKDVNEKNLNNLWEETDLLQELIQDSQKREITDQIKLEEESKEIMDAQQLLDELTILLYGRNGME